MTVNCQALLNDWHPSVLPLLRAAGTAVTDLATNGALLYMCGALGRSDAAQLSSTAGRHNAAPACADGSAAHYIKLQGEGGIRPGPPSSEIAPHIAADTGGLCARLYYQHATCDEWPMFRIRLSGTPAGLLPGEAWSAAAAARSHRPASRVWTRCSWVPDEAAASGGPARA